MVAESPNESSLPMIQGVITTVICCHLAGTINRMLTGRNIIVCFQGMVTGLRDSNSEVHHPIGIKLTGVEIPTMEKCHLQMEGITRQIKGNKNPSLLGGMPVVIFELRGRVGTWSMAPRSQGWSSRIPGCWALINMAMLVYFPLVSYQA